MISRLIESKPEELRIFIEEAAGISKYKERRRETESRMRRTLENLERLTDLRDELERQLQHLQRQSQAAEKYKDLKAQERALRQQLMAAQLRELQSQLATAAHEVGEHEVRLESVYADQQRVDTSLEQHRVTHSERPMMNWSRSRVAFTRSAPRSVALNRRSAIRARRPSRLTMTCAVLR